MATDEKPHDPMRKEYRPLTQDEQDQMADVKHFGALLYDCFSKIGGSRELSLAKTKLEEAVMWATKHITA